MRSRRSAAVLFLTTLALASCRRDAPYRIGVAVDEDGIRGADLAAAQVNAAGGINGHMLELRSERRTSSTSAQIALASAERLASDPSILAVVGHTNSSASLAASQVYNSRHIVQIAPTSTAPLYTKAGPYSFRLVASDVHQGVFLANVVKALSPHPKMAIVFVNDDYGRALRKVFVEQLHLAGVTPMYEAPYAEGDDMTDLREIVASLTSSRPDLLVWIGRAREFSLIAAEIHRALPTLRVLASDGFSGITTSRDSARVLDGIRCVSLLDFERPDSALRNFRIEYEAKAGIGEVTDASVLSHDAVILLAEALRAVGPNRTAIRDWLAQVGRERPAFAGLSGRVAFNADGDREPQYYLRVIGARRPGGVRTVATTWAAWGRY